MYEYYYVMMLVAIQLENLAAISFVIIYIVITVRCLAFIYTGQTKIK